VRILPVVMTWRRVEIIDDETGVAVRAKAMVPRSNYARLAERQYHDGEDYPMAPLEPRSRASHNAYFAELNEKFDSMPENLAEVGRRLNLKTIPPGGFVDSEHFRAWALCETGHCDVGEFDFDDKQGAENLARFYRKKTIYAQIVRRGFHVTIKEPFSQSASAMSKEPFEKSKRDVLDLVSAMIGIKEARRA
jgi:hypothetical protein